MPSSSSKPQRIPSSVPRDVVVSNVASEPECETTTTETENEPEGGKAAGPNYAFSSYCCCSSSKCNLQHQGLLHQCLLFWQANLANPEKQCFI
jgi:hypothetical protein